MRATHSPKTRVPCVPHAPRRAVNWYMYAHSTAPARTHTPASRTPGGTCAAEPRTPPTDASTDAPAG